MQKPLNKITISDITEDCGVNRMTFYYHFKDIYDLVEWMLEEDAARYRENAVSYDTWDETFADILRRIQENRPLVLNVYRAMSREQIEQYLYHMLDPALRAFVDREAQGITLRDDDRQFIIDFYKYGFVGVLLEWVRKDMKEEPDKIAERMALLLHGNMHQAVHRFKAGGLAVHDWIN